MGEAKAKKNIAEENKLIIERGIMHDRDVTDRKYFWTDFDNCLFENCSFMNCTFEFTSFYNCEFVDCAFINCNLERANFAYSKWVEKDIGNMFEKCNLTDSCFEYASLYCCTFTDSDLAHANFENVKIGTTYMSDVNMARVSLTGTDTDDLLVPKTSAIRGVPLACPEEGEFIGWKKVIVGDWNYEEPKYPSTVIIKLRIPADAKRSSAFSVKCRCDKAEVLDIQDWEGNSVADVMPKVVNRRKGVPGNDTVYAVGEMVYPDSFDENRWHECTNGIHFFMRREDAVNY